MWCDAFANLLVIPLLLWVDDVPGKVKAKICGDNKGNLRDMKTGRNPTMRHLARTRRICVAWLHEQHLREGFEVDYINTNSMLAYIFTKPTPSPIKRGHAGRTYRCTLINRSSCTKLV